MKTNRAAAALLAVAVVTALPACGQNQEAGPTPAPTTSTAPPTLAVMTMEQAAAEYTKVAADANRALDKLMGVTGDVDAAAKAARAAKDANRRFLVSMSREDWPQQVAPQAAALASQAGARVGPLAKVAQATTQEQVDEGMTALTQVAADGSAAQVMRAKLGLEEATEIS